MFVGEGAWGRIEASAIAVCKARCSGSCRAGGRALEAERFGGRARGRGSARQGKDPSLLSLGRVKL